MGSGRGDDGQWWVFGYVASVHRDKYHSILQPPSTLAATQIYWAVYW